MERIIQIWNERKLVILGIAVSLIAFALLTRVSVEIQIDGETRNVSHFFPQNVEDILTRNHISVGKNDLINVGMTDQVKNHMQIVIERAVTVYVQADWQTFPVTMPPGTAAEAITKAGVIVGEKDIVQTQDEGKTVNGQEIRVIRVTEQIINEDRILRFEVESTVDDTLEKGLSKTIKPGKNGVALDTVKIIYQDGQEVQRELLDTTVTQEPEAKIVAMGTITSVSRGGARFDFQTAMECRATAYTYTGYRTATGRNPAVGLVAVDPSVIPLGSKLYIEGYGYAEAADTGGSIRGNRVDLFLETREECIRWGIRPVRVYVL